jgi:glycosyltransferase involved in cell wall biosynthesis
VQIILATYGYPPYYWGGSESYVHWLARFLQKSGHQVLVIAGVTEAQLKETSLFFEDEHLQAGTYTFEGIPVVACSNHPTTAEIYSRYHPAWQQSWSNLLAACWKGQQEAAQLLHLHAVSPLINASLTEGARKVFPGLRVLYSYHVPESCPKGTLLYFGRSMCSRKPDPALCTACTLQDRYRVPSGLAGWLGELLVNVPVPESAPTPLKLGKYIRQNIASYRHFIGQVDHWFAFSHQIEGTLKQLGVASESISTIRHGIDEAYFQGDSAPVRREQPQDFVFVGRFKRVKGLLTLLRAWLQAAPDERRRLCLIGGDSNPDPEIAALLARAGSRSDIELAGILPAEQVRQRLASAHCIVIPSEWVEIGPLTLHEAIACGANVITSDIGGCAELAEFYGEACQTFRMGDANDLWQKISNFSYRPVSRKVRSQSEHNALILNKYEQLFASGSASVESLQQ